MSEAYSLPATWLRCSPVTAPIESGRRWSNNTSLTFVELHSLGAIGMPVWRLHLFCIMMNTDLGIIPSGGLKQSLKLSIFRGRVHRAWLDRTCPTNPNICYQLNVTPQWTWGRGGWTENHLSSDLVDLVGRLYPFPPTIFLSRALLSTAFLLQSASPWSSRAIQRHLTSPLPKIFSEAWKIQSFGSFKLSRCLMLGKRCMLLTDGTFFFFTFHPCVWHHADVGIWNRRLICFINEKVMK